MKKIIVAALVISMAATVQAQEIKDRPAEKPVMHESKKIQSEMDFKQLNLTEDQKAKLKEQAKDFRQQMQDLRKQDNMTVKDQREKMEALRKENKEKMQALLTPEQKTQLENMKMEGKAKLQGKGNERAENMKATLGLSDEQSQKLQSNRAEMAEKIKAIRENKSLDDAAKRDQMKELMKQQKVFLKSVLTDEQLQKLKETREKGARKKKGDTEMKDNL